jgi:hypothetical protein
MSFLLLANLAFATASAEEAADFTFHVPVEIENTIIWGISVKCTVHENEFVDGRFGGTGMLLIGRGSASATVVDGDFNGTLVVTVDAETGKLPALARSYSCQLSASWPLDPEVGYQQGVGDILASPGNFKRVYEEKGGRMLLSHVTTVNGPINQ